MLRKTNDARILSKYSHIQLTILVLLRIVIGWHFLYEGVTRLLLPHWSAASYLEVSRWLFASFFKWIAANPGVLKVVDDVNRIKLFKNNVYNHANAQVYLIHGPDRPKNFMQP